MVIPWVGIPLANFIKQLRADVEGEVRRVHDARRSASRCPGSGAGVLELAVRRRAAHGRGDAPADVLAVGLYGEVLPNQNGAPLRLVVPWKYGFKGIKSIVQDRVHREAAAQHAGSSTAPTEYGFYANVNPQVDHPRWSQATERRIGEFLQPQDADVQRLRRSGGEPLRGHGPQEELLGVTSTRHPLRAQAGRFPRRALGPAGRGWSGPAAHRQSQRQSAQRHHERNRRLDAALPLHHARDHAAAAPDRLERRRSGSAACWACSRSSTARCTS